VLELKKSSMGLERRPGRKLRTYLTVLSGKGDGDSRKEGNFLGEEEEV